LAISVGISSRVRRPVTKLRNVTLAAPSRWESKKAEKLALPRSCPASLNFAYQVARTPA
jgi:hypothetical protein